MGSSSFALLVIHETGHAKNEQVKSLQNKQRTDQWINHEKRTAMLEGEALLFGGVRRSLGRGE